MSCSDPRVMFDGRRAMWLSFALTSLLVCHAPLLAETERLTQDGLLKRDPIFWPDGQSLVYAVEQDSGRMKLVRLNLADGATSFVHDKDNISDRELTVSADGSVYVYNSVTGGKGIGTELLLRRLDSDETTRLPVKSWSHWPTISPDGQRVVFCENGQRMYLYTPNPDAMKKAEAALRVEAEKKHAEALAKEKDPKKRAKLKLRDPDAKSIAQRAGVLRQLVDKGYWPRFSADGKRIVFCSRRDDDIEVYVMDADGENQTRLTRSRGVDAHPVFSPDGRQIAFTSNRDGNAEVYVMNVDGSNVRRVTNHPERDSQSAWHADGKRLVIVSERDGLFDLYMVDVP